MCGYHAIEWSRPIVIGVPCSFDLCVPWLLINMVDCHRVTGYMLVAVK